MAHTIIPECPPLDTQKSDQELLDFTYANYQSSTRCADVAGELEAHEYHAGAADAYRAIILQLTGKDLISDRDSLSL